MTTRLINQIENAIDMINFLNVKTPVEQVDIADIQSDLKSALEKLQALKSYQESQDTDYDALWNERKEEIRLFKESRDAWLRTEIYTMLLKNLVIQTN